MKKVIFTLFLILAVLAGTYAQQPSGVIKKATEAPTLDGEKEALWDAANVYDIDKPLGSEVPTLGNAGETNWRALWTKDGIYILLTVTDDAFYPHYAVTPAGNNWEYDKPEIYFDVNFVLQDATGPATSGSGHYQVAPAFADGKNDGTLIEETNGVKHAFKVTGSNYVNEYFVPFSLLKDKEGVAVDQTGNIGFDVTIIDRDPGDAGRRRNVWANVGAVNESWSNMDDCGIITLEGATAGVDVESITLTGGTITKNNDTLRIGAAILPVDATNKTLAWSVVNETGIATISSDGLLKAVKDGTVKVIAKATDGSYVEAEVQVTISGQITTLWELNVIRNGSFDKVDENNRALEWGGWGGDPGSPMPTILEGWAVCTPLEAKADVWQFQYNQQNLTALPNVDYIFKFKAYADEVRTFNVDFEDISGNNYNRYGATTDTRSGNGRSDWTFDVTTEPTWYTFDVNFDQIVETTVQKVQFMLGTSIVTTYIDSVMLVTKEQYENPAYNVTEPNAVKTNKASLVSVYPNPLNGSNVLHLNLPSASSKITVYDNLGRRIEEKFVNSRHATINTSSYEKGIYFLKVNNESTVKFVK